MADDDPGYCSGTDDETFSEDDEEERRAFWDSFYEECREAAALPNCSSNGPQ